MGFLNPNKKYPLRVIIREQRGGHVRWAFDRGGRFKNEEGVDVIKLKKRKEEFPAPPFNFGYDIDDSKSSVIEVFSPKSGVYIPTRYEPDDVGEKLKISDSSVEQWGVLMRRDVNKLIKPKQPWWEKYIPLFSVLGIAAMLMISLIIVFNSMPTWVSQVGNVVDKVYQTSLVQAGVTPTVENTPPKVGG